MSKFEKTYCSQCGGEFGPGDHGFSHCSDHMSEIERFRHALNRIASFEDDLDGCDAEDMRRIAQSALARSDRAAAKSKIAALSPTLAALHRIASECPPHHPIDIDGMEKEKDVVKEMMNREAARIGDIARAVLAQS